MTFAYDVPEVPILLTLFSLLYFLNVAEAIFNYTLEAGLLGSIVIGIVYGPEVGNILPDFVLQTLLILGYIGLILLVFEAGLSTNIALLYKNLALSIIVGGTGVLFPIAFSILLVRFGYGYTVLEAFAAGASLSSTSLGTTLALLKPELRQTRMGVVLLSAALFDDVVGLVIAAIIEAFSSNATGTISWRDIVRPTLVSVAFAVATGVLVWLIRPLSRRMPEREKRLVYQTKTQLLILALVISGFVAGANYAGTSELFGAYLAGVLVAQILHSPPEAPQPSRETPIDTPFESRVSLTLVANSVEVYTPHLTFTVFIQPILQHVLSPIFFASIGSALPIRSLGSVNGSSRVIWRGIVYALLMAVAKVLTGVWLLIPPGVFTLRACFFWRKKSSRTRSPSELDKRSGEAASMSGIKSAVLLGFAMVARGEIALIVSQLARPILAQGSQELYAIVIWAILVDTVGGALGVGLILRSQGKEAN